MLACWLRGSSPRAWGTPHRYAEKAEIMRFIPTGVGNSAATVPKTSVVTVHPHGRGELAPEGKKLVVADGSSPRAWGTRGYVGQRRRPERFIPTGVGNSS